MAHFLSRSLVNERLRLHGSTSYAIVATTGYGNRISSDRVVEILNRSRRGDIPALSSVPSDLMTAEELCAIPELADAAVTPHEIITWARRTHDPLPHYRLNSHTRRYPRTDALAWMERKWK